MTLLTPDSLAKSKHFGGSQSHLVYCPGTPRSQKLLCCEVIAYFHEFHPVIVITLQEGERLCLRHVGVLSDMHNYTFTAVSSKAVLVGHRKGRWSR